MITLVSTSKSHHRAILTTVSSSPTNFLYSKGEKVTAKAHGGSIDIEGVSVALVDDKLRIQKIETWFDPMEMFKQIAPHGVVNKEIVNRKVGRSDDVENSAESEGHDDTAERPKSGTADNPNKTVVDTPSIASQKTLETSQKHDAGAKEQPEDAVDDLLSRSVEQVHLQPKDMEKAVDPKAGDAVVAPANSEEVKLTHEEMSRIAPMECPFMNRE